MPIAKKPTKTEKKSESEISAVISKGGSVAKDNKSENQKILIRIPSSLLDRVDSDLASRPFKTSRNTWILEAVLEKLEKPEKRK